MTDTTIKRAHTHKKVHTHRKPQKHTDTCTHTGTHTDTHRHALARTHSRRLIRFGRSALDSGPREAAASRPGRPPLGRPLGPARPEIAYEERLQPPTPTRLVRYIFIPPLGFPLPVLPFVSLRIVSTASSLIVVSVRRRQFRMVSVYLLSTPSQRNGNQEDKQWQRVAYGHFLGNAVSFFIFVFRIYGLR